MDSSVLVDLGADCAEETRPAISRSTEEEINVTNTGTTNKTVVGIFHDFREANQAMQDLVSHGINRDDISLVANEHVSGQMREAGYDPTVNIGTGAGVGAAIGGAGGLLLSLAGLAIPGIGPILAAGPLVAALGGAGVGAAVGSIVGALMNLGIPEEEAGHYAESVRRGDVLLAVKTNDMQAETVREVLDRNGAVDIENRVSNWRDEGYTKFDQESTPYTAEDYRMARDRYRPDRTPGNTLDRLGDGAATMTDRVDTSTYPTTGDRLAQGARNAEYDMERGAHNLGRDMREGTRDAGEWVEDKARDTGRGMRDLGNRTKDAVEDAGRAIRRGAARVYDRARD